MIKPSDLSAWQTQILVECLHAANLLPGLFNVVTGRGECVGAEITRHPDIAKISFTGSGAVGKTIARDAAATLKRLTLELGGKSANVLLDDANFEQAIPLALKIAYMNNGQACLAGTRLLVAAKRLNEAKRLLTREVSGWKVGGPGIEDTQIGPMVTKQQYHRVEGYIRSGIEEGAELLAGGEGRPADLARGYFVKPTIFVGVKPEMRIAREEIFGPVLSVLTYETEDGAVRMANDTTYGLHAYVSTNLMRRSAASRSPASVGSLAPSGWRRTSSLGPLWAESVEHICRDSYQRPDVVDEFYTSLRRPDGYLCSRLAISV